MGSWGAGVNGNDTAMDLRAEYQAAFCYFDVDTALKRIDEYVRNAGFDESDEGQWCDYFYSLADYMRKKGILTEAVQKRAVEMIDTGFGLEVWAESGEAALKARKKALERFREKLCSQQTSRKKITIKLFTKPILSAGDIVAFQLQTMDKTFLADSCFDEAFFRSCHGKWVVMRKAYDDVSYRSAIVPAVQDIWPCFQLYAAIFDECPAMDKMEGIPWAKTRHNPGYGLFCSEGSLSCLKRRNYRVIGSSVENIGIQDKIGVNKDDLFFGASNDSYNADSVILNAIVG